MVDDIKGKKDEPKIDYKKKYEDLKTQYRNFVSTIEDLGFQLQVLAKNRYKTIN